MTFADGIVLLLAMGAISLIGVIAFGYGSKPDYRSFPFTDQEVDEQERRQQLSAALDIPLSPIRRHGIVVQMKDIPERFQQPIARGLRRVK